ncbi:MAG TPA: type II secretion system protein GspM [Anaeromyxobacteraceae bacterium]|nr:type II secretion system protein GspM [Anaeromyxobacteraceae bacterium]
MEFLRRLRAELETAFGRLAPRERVMVSGALLALVAFVLFLVFTQVQRGIRTREAAIDRKTQVLAQIGQLAQGYRQAQAERGQLETKLKGPPVALIGFVSQAGQKLGIEVPEIRQGGSSGAPPSQSDKVLEDTVEVNLAKIDLTKLVQLLGDLERGPGVVKIRRLALRTRNDDPLSVDATIVVATYQLKASP